MNGATFPADSFPADTFPARLFLLGCGNMAGAMLSRWLDTGLDPARVTVLRKSGRPVAPGVDVVTDYPASLPDGTLLMIGVKPQMLAEVAPRLAAIDGRVVYMSILAGVTADGLRNVLPDGADIVRIMPNTPVEIGRGVCVLHADEITGAAARDAVTALMQPLGLVDWIEEEAQFDLVTALSGCGPAFLFRFIGALGMAAFRLGLPADQAMRLATATVDGAAGLAAGSSIPPSRLADQVASPGGMTRRGLDILDADERLVTLMTQTLTAARDRGVELARLAAGEEVA